MVSAKRIGENSFEDFVNASSALLFGICWSVVKYDVS